MRFKLSAEAKKYISNQDKQTRNKIYEGLRGISKEPPQGDIKALSSDNTLYRLRIGGLRIIYEYDKDNILVDKIAPRGQAYKH